MPGQPEESRVAAVISRGRLYSGTEGKKEKEGERAEGDTEIERRRGERKGRGEEAREWTERQR